MTIVNCEQRYILHLDHDHTEITFIQFEPGLAVVWLDTDTLRSRKSPHHRARLRYWPRPCLGPSSWLTPWQDEAREIAAVRRKNLSCCMRKIYYHQSYTTYETRSFLCLKYRGVRSFFFISFSLELAKNIP